MRIKRATRMLQTHTKDGITMHLMGGMGNQMFQYAMGRATALRLGVPLKLHIASFDFDEMRSYSLGLWAGVRSPLVKEYSGPVIRESGMPYNMILANSIPKHATLHGYWQTEKYFLEIKSILQEEFQPRALTPFARDIHNKILDEGNKSAFLTIRRTDYLHTDYHGILSMDYYIRACSMIADQVPDPHFFIFTDDIPWATSHFMLPFRTTIAGNHDKTTGTHLGREDVELWLMRQCKHAVMANSSYSWWGAWLNDNPDGSIVIAPSRWFLNSPEDPRDIVPERWIKI